MKSVTVNFDDGAIEVIERLRKATGCNSGEVIRDALSFYEWARVNINSRTKIGSFNDKGENCVEVILPFRKNQ